MNDRNDTVEPGRPGAVPPPPPPPPAGPPIYITVPPAKRGGRLGRALLLVLLIASIVFNIILIGRVASTLSGQFTSTVLTQGAESQQVSVYDISGMIDDSQATLFQTFVREVKTEPNVRAVVLRVNSPGGGVSASDQMHKSVQELVASGRTVVVSMGNTAASGGYYLSVAASRIYAEPTTVTGSIGVIGFFPVIKGTLDKLGVQVVTITSQQAAQWKDSLSPFREVQPKDVQYMQDILNKLQLRFNAVVLEGRKKYLTSDDVIQLADGRVWLGSEAAENHLVDEVGYLTDAINGAAELAGLKNPHVVQYHRRAGLFEQFTSQAPGLHVDAKLLEDIQTPRLMMLWKVQ